MKPYAAFKVESGHVDLFLAPLTGAESSDGAPPSRGPRSHIARIEKGGIVFKIDLSATANGWTIFSQPASEAKLQPVDLDGISAECLEKWVELMAGVVSCNTLESGKFRALSPNSMVEIAGDLLPVASAKRTVWVKHLRGEGRFLGDPNLPPVNGDRYFPLSMLLWLAEEPGNSLAVLSTEAALTDKKIWAGLALFHRVIGKALVVSRQAAEAKEITLLEARRAEDEIKLDAAIRHLTAPFARTGEEAEFQTHTSDILLKACQAIGVRQGIEFKASPEMIRKLAMRDPLSSLCRSSGARHRRIALSGNWYRSEGQPLLAYRETDGSPVALLPRRSGSYSQYDPATELRTKVNREVADSLQPFAYCFYRSFPAKQLNLKDLCLFGTKGSWRDLTLVLILALLVGLMGMVMPILTRRVFDDIIPGAQRNNLLGIALFILTASLASTFIGLTRGFALLRIENQMEARVEAAIWIRLLSLPATFFRQFSAGDLESRAMSISAIRQLLTHSAMAALFSGIFSIGNFVLLFYYSVPLAFVAVVLTSVQLAAFIGFTLTQFQIQTSTLDVQGRLYGLLLQLIANISKFRVSATENRAFVAWSRVFVAYRKRSMHAARLSIKMTVFSSVFSIASSMAIFWMTSRITAGAKGFTTGDFMAFMAAYGSFSGALMNLGQVVVGLIVMVPLYRRVKPILNAAPESDPSKQFAGELAGEINLRNVSFRYRRDGPQILKNISLSIAAGEFVAIVGPTGSGKSTLARLLLGLERPDTGTISFDGQDITNLDIASVRQQMGVVMQNSTVFSGDIYTNIAASAPYSLDEAWEAARVAALEDDVKAMPMGMHTVLGEGGVGLSGGQRQRLMIARAVAGKPRILLFDEATSALDNHTQDRVSRNLQQLQSTRVVIAHRLTTVMAADRIFVIEGGSLVQSGSYEELSVRAGPFAELAKRQLTDS